MHNSSAGVCAHARTHAHKHTHTHTHTHTYTHTHTHCIPKPRHPNPKNCRTRNSQHCFLATGRGARATRNPRDDGKGQLYLEKTREWEAVNGMSCRVLDPGFPSRHRPGANCAPCDSQVEESNRSEPAVYVETGQGRAP